MIAPYPNTPAERDQWIVSLRGPRNVVDVARPYACLLEQEPGEPGQLVDIATIFLTNRECPWRCLMCDLWKNTLPESTADIPSQIDRALAELPGASSATQIKLYNSGSFFDPRAVPPDQYDAIAQRLQRFDRVIVECHPSLIRDPLLRFRDLLPGKLEVAMGLEIAHPEILQKLNKRMTLELFARASAFLKENEMDLRVFILVKPPFILDEAEALHWTNRSSDFAVDCGARVISLIPTRAGNGAMEALGAQGEFAPPRLPTLESALDYGIALGQARVFADLWDLEQFSDCPNCFPARRARLASMNLLQRMQPRAGCKFCGGG